MTMAMAVTSDSSIAADRSQVVVLHGIHHREGLRTGTRQAQASNTSCELDVYGMIPRNREVACPRLAADRLG